jgi:hypothetical protein
MDVVTDYIRDVILYISSYEHNTIQIFRVISRISNVDRVLTSGNSMRNCITKLHSCYFVVPTVLPRLLST